MPFANGENVGVYCIVEKLGQGGMATVFKAYHPSLDRYVAIKVMHPAFTEDPNFLARFQREARIVAKLDHPHIVPIYDFAEHRGNPYLVMRFIDGETLKARMQRAPLDLQEVPCIARAVGEALTYAHEQGVLHRDIKPSNILLTPDGVVYLTDFGLARMAEAGESTLSRDMLAGTPQYISPEQAKGLKKLDARTDVYSLGVVLYELLAGQVPFTADTPYAIIHDHIFAPLPLPRQLNPDLSEPLERVLLKALAKEPDDRFQSVEELISALEAALKPTPAPSPAETIVVPPPTAVRPVGAVEKLEEKKPKEERPEEKVKPRKKKRRWPCIVAGVAAFLLLASIVGLVVINQQQQAGTLPGPEDVERLLESARAAREKGHFDHALDLYQQTIEADPHLIPAYMEASGLLIEIRDTDEAMFLVMEGLKDNPDNPALHKRAAGVATLTKRWDVAQREVEWLLREMPEDAFSHACAASLALAQGHPCEEVHPELDAALRLDPELAWAHYSLALCHLQEDNPEAARAELEFVLGQEDIPHLLRVRAEQRLGALEPGLERETTIEREFEALLPLIEEIPQEHLRMPLNEMLNHARIAWQRGDRGSAIQTLEETHVWIQEHQDDLGIPLAEELNSRLDHIIHLAAEP